MRVIATAGHVDHGKSTLVRALTGIEPDRWGEEKRRGLTIDLGYAWTELALSGGGSEQVAFVDVPGHERFIANMLAGVGPVPAAMLVVAADEGWRHQSQEHLDALAALGIEHGLLVVTRSDLADPASAIAEAREHLRGTPLAGVEAVPVSAMTGEGIPALREALARLCQELPAPDADARARLWIDRVFSVKGAGTVVTGTLAQGRLRVGDRVHFGADGEAGIRSIQMLETPAEQADAVARVAVNLRGVGVGDLARGDTLRTGSWHLTASTDVRLEPVAGRPLDDLPEQLMAHVGTAALQVRVRPLDATTARLTWPRDLPLAVGDRVILRDPGQQKVLCGAVLLDVDPPALTRRGDARRRAEALASASGRLDTRREVERRGAMRAAHLAALGGDPSASVEGVLAHGDWLVSRQQWDAWTSTLRERVVAHAAAHPREARMAMAAAATVVGLPDAALVTPLARAAGLELTSGYVAPMGAQASLGDKEPALVQVEQRLASNPFNAPEREDLQALGLTSRDLAIAVRLGRLIDLGDLIYLTPKAPALAMRELSRLPQPFTTSQARQALQTTRRVAIPLLELLDRKGWTRRLDGTHRTVVR